MKRVKRNVALLSICVALVVVASACRKSASVVKPVAVAAPNAAIDWNTAGTIAGTVHFAGKPPSRIEIDMGQDPACALIGGTNMTEQYVVHDGKLANVFVSIAAGLGSKIYAPPAEPVVLDQKGCRYDPHVIGVMAGQPVEFTNSDPTMHNVHTEAENGNPEVNISQPPKQGTTREVFQNKVTMMPVHCANHPWMEAFINVAPNPFYAVSDASGHFEIRGVPPGTYTVRAIHEQLGTQSAQVTVQPKQAAATDFTFRTATNATQ